jgi:thioredoxin reductase (NADPH)
LPLVCAAEKPTRAEALKYYRKTAEHYELELRLYERVIRVHGQDGSFTVVTKLENGIEARYEGKKIVVATGYYDLPNRLGVPGEELPHVSHYYTQPHEYWRQDVVVVGGKNSAAEAALDLYRNGARVTLIHRGKELGKTIKYWVRPDIDNRIKAGQIQALLEARVDEIMRDEVMVEQHGQTKRLPAKQVFALTGYHPDFSFLSSLGVHLDPESKRPAVDPNSLESNVPGIHLAGVVIGGRHTGEIFIENGRFHGKQIIESLRA